MPRFTRSLCRSCLLATLALGVAAQPKVGYVEVFGVRKLSADRIMKAAGIAEGAALPKSRSGLEEALVAMDGVAVAHVEAFCCEQGEPILYVGILERGTPLFEYRPEPDGEVSLSEEDAGAYAGFAAALGRATSEDDLAEDLTAGHSMMRNPDCRAYQLRFAEIAEQRLENVRAVLARAADPEQRAAAAYIIGYAVNKRVVVGDLQAALRDASPSVRLNATSALRAIAVLGRDKSLGISIPATWFVEMLNSVVLADRLAGSRTLNLMYDEFSEGTMAQIKERALSSLFEMARWRHLQHALPAYLLLGRVSGVAEQEMAAAWEASERDQMLARIEKLLKPVTAKKK